MDNIKLTPNGIRWVDPKGTYPKIEDYVLIKGPSVKDKVPKSAKDLGSKT